MFRYIFIFIFLFILFESCAQLKPANAGYVFTQPSFKGNIPVDEEGNPVHSGIDTFYFAVIELNNDIVLTVDSIRYKGKYLTASAFKIEEKQWIAGTRKDNADCVVMEAGEGNSLWRIEFTPDIKNNKINKQPLVIKGKNKGKAFTIELKQEIELLPVEKY